MSNRTLAYLASPYAKYPGGREKAFIDVTRIAARLLRSGVMLYSPITHSHPLAVYGEIKENNHAFWLPFDEIMMDRCDILIVAHMPGWEESKGIAHEVAFFEKAGKPIFDLCDLATCQLVRREK